MKPTAKKTTAKVSKLTDQKFYGGEPIFKEKVATSSEMAHVLNWYSGTVDDVWKDSRRYILAFLKEHKAKKDIVDKIKNCPPYKIPCYVGWICRQISIKSNIPAEIKKQAVLKLKEITEDASIVSVETEEISEEEKKPVISLEERFNRKVSDTIALIEEYHDSFMKDLKIPEKTPYDILTSESVSGKVAEKVAAFYQPKLEEIEKAYAGKTPDLKDAYSYTKPQLKTYIKFLTSIVEDSKRISSNIKAAKKPRKKKVKSAESIVKTIKFKKDDTSLKITSIDPINILGAKQVWLFNTKTRFLTSLVSSEASGFTVKGASILGVDEKLSESKKIRKPDETLKQLLSSGKVALRTFMKDIKSKPGVPKTRTNSDTVIIKAIK